MISTKAVGVPLTSFQDGSKLKDLATNAAGSALAADNAAFRAAVASQIDPKRAEVAKAIKADKAVLSGIDRWDTLNIKQRLAVLTEAAKVEAKAMGFTLPKVEEVAGSGGQGSAGTVPAEFIPGKDELVFFDQGLAKYGGWIGLDIALHETEHAHQMELVQQLRQGKLKKGSPEEALARGFASDLGANEGGLSSFDYQNLCVEYDAYQTGNKIVTLVGAPSDTTLGIGSWDAQYDPVGSPVVDVAAMEKKAGAQGLYQAVKAENDNLNQAQSSDGD